MVENYDDQDMDPEEEQAYLNQYRQQQDVYTDEDGQEVMMNYNGQQQYETSDATNALVRT